jgi:phage terminase large subunit
MSSLTLDIAPEVFNEAYLPTYGAKQRTQIKFGGSSSGKSYSEFMMSILMALQGQSILVVRKNASSISKSVWLMLKKSIRTLKLNKYFKVQEASKTIECLVSDGCIITAGMYPDPERIKSITPLFADAFSRVIVEEATELSEDDFNQLLLRQRGITKFPKTIVLLFNPIFQKHWIYKRFFKPLDDDIDFNGDDFFKYEDDEILILKTTYLDNRFLGPEEIKTLEDLKKTSPYHYEVYAKGNFGVLGERVFDHFQVKDFNVQDLRLDLWGSYIGIDFGFTNDPTACVFLTYDEQSRTIYIFDEFGGKGLTEEDIYLGVQQRCDIHGLRYPSINADNSEPRTINRLNTLGLPVQGLSKLAIHDGIFWIKQNKVVVHPRCVELLDEYALYTWIKDNDGTVTNKPIDKYNHYVSDSTRYGLHKFISGEKYIGWNKRI